MLISTLRLQQQRLLAHDGAIEVEECVVYEVLSLGFAHH